MHFQVKSVLRSWDFLSGSHPVHTGDTVSNRGSVHGRHDLRAPQSNPFWGVMSCHELLHIFIQKETEARETEKQPHTSHCRRVPDIIPDFLIWTVCTMHITSQTLGTTHSFKSTWLKRVLRNQRTYNSAYKLYRHNRKREKIQWIIYIGFWISGHWFLPSKSTELNFRLLNFYLLSDWAKMIRIHVWSTVEHFGCISRCLFRWLARRIRFVLPEFGRRSYNKRPGI